MPASETIATVRPSPTSATIRSTRSCSLCSCSERRVAPVIPAWVSSLREWRVSSQ